MYAFAKQFAASYRPCHPYVAACVCVCGIVTNLINIIVFHQIRMRTPTNALLRLIAISDAVLMIDYLIIGVGAQQSFDFPGICDQTHTKAVITLFHANAAIFLYAVGTWLTIALGAFRCAALHTNGRTDTFQRAYTLAVVVFVSCVVLCVPNYMCTGINALPKSSHNICATMYNFSQIGDIYAVGPSEFSFQYGHIPLRVAFWVTALMLKIIPCALLTVIIFFIVGYLMRAKTKRKHLLQRCRFSVINGISARNSNDGDSIWNRLSTNSSNKNSINTSNKLSNNTSNLLSINMLNRLSNNTSNNASSNRMSLSTLSNNRLSLSNVSNKIPPALKCSIIKENRSSSSGALEDSFALLSNVRGTSVSKNKSSDCLMASNITVAYSSRLKPDVYSVARKHRNFDCGGSMSHLNSNETNRQTERLNILKSSGRSCRESPVCRTKSNQTTFGVRHLTGRHVKIPPRKCNSQTVPTSMISGSKLAVPESIVTGSRRSVSESMMPTEFTSILLQPTHYSPFGHVRPMSIQRPKTLLKSLISSPMDTDRLSSDTGYIDSPRADRVLNSLPLIPIVKTEPSTETTRMLSQNEQSGSEQRRKLSAERRNTIWCVPEKLAPSQLGPNATALDLKRPASFGSVGTLKLRINGSKSECRSSVSTTSLSRTSFVLIGILTIFLVTQAPQGICLTLTAVLPTKFRHEFYNNFAEFSELLSLINCSVNFILYCAVSTEYRMQCSELITASPLNCFVKRPSRNEHSASNGCVVDPTDHFGAENNMRRRFHGKVGETNIANG